MSRRRGRLWPRRRDLSSRPMQTVVIVIHLMIVLDPGRRRPAAEVGGRRARHRRRRRRRLPVEPRAPSNVLTRTTAILAGLSSPPAWCCRSWRAWTASRTRSSATPARRPSRRRAPRRRRDRAAACSTRSRQAGARRRRLPGRRCRGRSNASFEGPGDRPFGFLWKGHAAGEWLSSASASGNCGKSLVGKRIRRHAGGAWRAAAADKPLVELPPRV